jgi:hypothetical protein
MALNAQLGVPCVIPAYCLDLFGCGSNQCPNFTIKRHDTQPPLRVEISDCDGALNMQDPLLVAEVNMWANAKIRKAVTAVETVLSFADNIGFYQALPGDVIVVDAVRGPEHMAVTGFDENLKTITVQRGFAGTTARAWARGTSVRIFRTMNAPAEIQLVLSNVQQEDGTVLENVLSHSYLTYNWGPNDTCMPGCYWLEFKLLKMLPPVAIVPDDGVPVSPSATPDNRAMDSSCSIGVGVQWVRRFPESQAAFLIKIIDSPTAELPPVGP